MWRQPCAHAACGRSGRRDVQAAAAPERDRGMGNSTPRQKPRTGTSVHRRLHLPRCVLHQCPVGEVTGNRASGAPSAARGRSVCAPPVWPGLLCGGGERGCSRARPSAARGLPFPTVPANTSGRRGELALEPGVHLGSPGGGSSDSRFPTEAPVSAPHGGVSRLETVALLHVEGRCSRFRLAQRCPHWCPLGSLTWDRGCALVRASGH